MDRKTVSESEERHKDVLQPGSSGTLKTNSEVRHIETEIVTMATRERRV